MRKMLSRALTEEPHACLKPALTSTAAHGGIRKDFQQGHRLPCLRTQPSCCCILPRSNHSTASGSFSFAEPCADSG